MSNRAALIAVITAFLVGIIGSLAVRPPGQVATASTVDSGETVQVRHSWKVPGVFQSTMPVLGDNPSKGMKI